MTMIDDPTIKLRKALAECARLKEENARLQALLGISAEGGIHHTQETSHTITNSSPTEDKVTLFRSLFRGREDLYPVRWEGKNGRSGYTPACAHEWDKALCGKPKIKCGDCENRKFLPVTDGVICDHLTGKHTIGVYPLLLDETCWFLAVDFDKTNWQDDVSVFLETCSKMDVPTALERSRSGRGGHVWIFFESPIPASTARKLGCAVLTRSMEKRPQVGIDSYDRFFPNQDTMPKGGFGNLIALPLQHEPRSNGNTLFLNKDFQPHEDQWHLLSTIRKMSLEEVDKIVREATRTGKIIGVRMSQTEDDGDEDPWTLPPSGEKPEKPIEGLLPETVRIVQGNLIYIEKEGLPPAMLNRLTRIAAFQNPEFYRAQAIRLSTFGKPRVICCAEDFPQYLGIPRGCLDDVLTLLRTHNIRTEIVDERSIGVPIEVAFKGVLRPLQKDATEALLPHDNAVLSATTAFGKTVIAAWLIATRKVNTLVLAHRRQLMDQWIERLRMFLDVPQKNIGQIGGGKENRTGFIDVAMIQSLNRKGEVKDLVAEYGQVIVDECHHIPAFSFEQVLRQVRAKYILGLTATPIRKDGHHPIIVMQCGPIRFRVRDRDQATKRPFEHIVIPKHTDFRMLLETSLSNYEQVQATEPTIHDVYATLVGDTKRNDLIFDDLLRALEARRSPLLLTERTEHLEEFSKRLKGFAKNVIVLKGGMGKKQRKELADRIAAIPDEEERVIIATGRYIGEGFDDARLDTLFLATPISWRGTLQQYAGRLHRLHDNKRVVQIYDYVDIHVPMLIRMYKKRLKGYKAIGYSIKENEEVLFDDGLWAGK